MFVASGVEFGNEGVLALLPQVTGYIQTAIGCGTLRRANGIAVRVMVGDPVCQGDVIETAADGRIGIRFIDGTVFNLSGDTRVVISEFSHSNSTSHSPLFEVTRGTFAFIAGEVANTKGLRVDTPFGSIRGPAHAGGVGTLSLVALIFAAMNEGRAAEPNVTFLDDGSITYKDLEHGVFELVTKEAIPRHIIVEDPGETIVLHPRGSTISVNQVPNTATRMGELQTAQQEVMATFAKGLGPNGSSTPPLVNPLPLQPIKFFQPDGPSGQNALPPLPIFVFPEFTTQLTPPQPPILNTGAGPTEIDTVVFDTFSTTSGTFGASSSTSGAKFTYGISGGIAGNTVLGGVTYDESRPGAFGTLYVNSTSGAYTFVPNSGAINALTSPTTQSFAITVSDGTLSTTQTFTINIDGVNDAAIISGTAAGAVIEVRGVVNATPGTQTSTGTLTDTDVDNPPNTFTAVGSPTPSAGGYGSFTMTAAGVWTYTLNNANSMVQALNVGGTLIDSFTVSTVDGTPQAVTITIHGPLIAAMGTAPSLTLSETHLAATALDDSIAGSAPDATLTMTSGNFSTAFTSVQGVDGATISYALSIAGGNGTASGLIDSHTGQADVLVLNGNTIEGHVGAVGGALAFTITIDPTTGLVTFTEYRAVTQPLGTNPDSGEGVSLTAGVVNLTATITDKDGVFQTASIELGSRLIITDDGPMIVATGTSPSLTLSETHLTATALDDNIAGSAPDATLTMTSGNFSTAFTSVQGADGATISYALSIAGGNGTASGLIDSHTGQADVLVLNGNTIEGHVGTTGGTLAFTITLDPTTGLVTFTEYRAVTQPLGTNPDSGEGVSLTAGVVNLTATITDKDGDFQSASLELGSRLTITDDGPMIGGFGEISIVAQNNQVVTGNYNVSFGADGDGAMGVAIHNGAVNGFNLATTDLGGGITSVHVTGNGDDYTFYYTTRAVSSGVELNAFFTDTSGTLSDPFFTLLINPDGTYTFDIESVGLLQQTTVSGSDFGASSSGQSSLTSPDGLLVITGDFNGAPADVKASSNGIAVGDTGLQMDQQETLLLKFMQEQTDVSFILTQWQGNGTADVVFKVHDGATDIHDFNINIPKPSGDARIVVEKTSNLALVNTYTFDSATSTYTLYVGSEFDQIGVSYDHAVTGNATFTANSITYDARTIPSTDLLFDVTAVDGDADSSSASLQVDLLGGTSAASSLALSSTPSVDALVGGNATLTDAFMATTISGTPQAVTTTNADADISGTATGFVLEAFGSSPGRPTATGTLTDTDVDNPFNTFTAVSSPRVSDGGYGFFTMTAAGVWTYTLDNANGTVHALDVGDTLTDTFTVHTVDGTAQLVTITIDGASDADPNDNLATGTTVISDPPFGTPGHDSVAGRGDAGQSAADDTIYEDSGSDTINGNNGNNHTIIGGFGADNLTGGNGNDRFVYLPGVDSHAGQFDTITDFASGSDKIDLTALGALAFLALTSTSTSVPAHTIAWLYDSAANETIVYVNPTDQTLSIGNSGLLEIHLQGIATILASDFVTEPAHAPVVVAGESIDLALAATAGSDGIAVTTNTADASSLSTVSDSALVADGTRTLQTTDKDFSFDAGRDWFDLPGHDGFAFGEGRSDAIEITTDDAVITLANGPSIEPNRVHVMGVTENSFVFGQAPVPQTIEHGGDGGGIAGSHGGQFGNGELNATNAGLINAAGTHGHSIDAGPNVAHTPGALQGSGNHGATIASSRGPWTDSGHQTHPGEATGHGVATEGGSPAGKLGLGDSFHFKDEISGLVNSNPVVPADVGITPASFSHHGNAVGAGGTQAISGEIQAVELSPLGQHSADDFSIAPNHAGGGNAVTHVLHDLMV